MVGPAKGKRGEMKEKETICGPYCRRQYPTNKRVTIALRYIHGIGAAKAAEICEKVGIAPERPRQPAFGF